jgi:transmembrane 9 superfamily protein 3
VVVILIWVFISFPLCLFGTIVGRNWNGVPDNPCRWAGAAIALCRI